MTLKSDLRRTAAAHRASLVRSGHDLALAAHAAALSLEPHAVVAGYCAFRDEADPRSLMLALERLGHPLALPVMLGKGLPLRFQRWSDGDAMCVHPYGVSEPLPNGEAVVPPVLLVPLLAFDRRGFRLGYGGGFYDRTLQGLRAEAVVQAIGIAYAGQEVAEVPHDQHDQPLDAVLTENGLIRF
jgi:5-formyltetrahydrofolate cyclo-ligase